MSLGADRLPGVDVCATLNKADGSQLHAYGAGPIAADGGTPTLLLKAKEAARALNISDRTLWELTRRGEIKCVRHGGIKRYALGDLNEWIARERGRFKELNWIRRANGI